MANHNKTLPALLVLGCLAVASLPLPALAGGNNGVVVLTRDVQPRQGDRPTRIPDPNPTTVNTNESARIKAQTNELTDGDFASVASGSVVNRMFQPDGSGTLRGMDTVQTRLPGMVGGSGSGAGGGNGISNSVNQSVQRGLAPLQILTRGQ
ncbi:hypothetical protein [Pseudomonas xantholysinigenes]|uniref:Fap n=1 Tax=Pseudomonas xantholysinigenes TaxID=2745490 RepID=A0A9E6Q1P6_9PSED|nr:hypothetical protein [Pseudomonas xantholysinigenes]QXI40647.1 hypothetical protein HU772_011455 [Pseudomonas xantholysinigenes]